MGLDNSAAVQTAIITHLASFAPLTALVPPERIYGVRPAGSNPQFPFVRYGAPLVRPYEATCYTGAENIISIHAFAEGEDSYPVSEIAAQIVAAMDTLEDAILMFLDNRWTTTQIIPDNDESTNWHAIINFEVTAVTVA